MKLKVEFEGLSTEIDSNLLLSKVLDIDFNGEMMVRFESELKLLDEFSISFTCFAINGINGHGQNIASEISGKPLKFLKLNS